MYEVISGCRSCGSSDLEEMLAFGEMPLADGLLSAEQLALNEPKFPLTVVYCRRCTLMQILETVSPEALYCQDYPYYSSFSDALLEHSRRNAERLTSSRQLTARSLVVEVASNDGYMLKNFAKRGIPVLGIDPAEGPAKAAQNAGVPTLCTFFGRELAVKLRNDGAAADVIIANNVLAHVPDLNGLVEGMGILLKTDGLIAIEVPYAIELIEHCEFDTIYHEHHCYFTVTALAELFRRHDLSLNHVEHYPIHGGSLRLYVERQEDVADSVKLCLEREDALSLASGDYYRGFAARVENVKERLVRMLREFRSDGSRIAAYGAAAKGSTLLNFAGIGRELIDFVVDRNVHKQGRYMPGVHIPIDAPERLLEDMPDYTLMLPWNFKEEILGQQERYRKRGGKFVVPIPDPTVV